MYKYYYAKNEKFYSLTDKTRLYEITCKNNLELILQLENVIESLTSDLNTEDYKYLEFNNLSNKEKYSLIEMLKMIPILFSNYLPNSYPELITLESSILLAAINDFIKMKNERNLNIDNYLNDALTRYLKELKEELINIKNISKYTQQEVDLSNLEPQTVKFYLPDIEKLTDEHYKHIDLITASNEAPQKILDENLKNQIYTYAEQIIVNKIKKENDLEKITAKINYQYLKTEQIKNTYFKYISYLLATPLTFFIFNNSQNNKTKICLALYLLGILGYQKIDYDLQNKLKITSNPILTLNKKN